MKVSRVSKTIDEMKGVNRKQAAIDAAFLQAFVTLSRHQKR